VRRLQQAAPAGPKAHLLEAAGARLLPQPAAERVDHLPRRVPRALRLRARAPTRRALRQLRDARVGQGGPRERNGPAAGGRHPTARGGPREAGEGAAEVACAQEAAALHAVVKRGDGPEPDDRIVCVCIFLFPKHINIESRIYCLLDRSCRTCPSVVCRRSELANIADGSDPGGGGHVSSAGVTSHFRVGDLPTSSVSGPQLVPE